MLGAAEAEIEQLKSTQLQLSDLRAEHSALARDYAAMEEELATAKAKVASLENELVDGTSSSAEQMNELRYQLVHAKADKEELLSKAEHDKAKMYGILKELEAQLREATGGEPTANLAKMMGEFTDTMGSGEFCSSVRWHPLCYNARVRGEACSSTSRQCCP